MNIIDLFKKKFTGITVFISSYREIFRLQFLIRIHLRIEYRGTSHKS